MGTVNFFGNEADNVDSPVTTQPNRAPLRWEEATSRAEREFGRYYCRRCADKAVVAAGDSRYSMGVYAGMLCDTCWEADGRNHDRTFDPMDAGENYSEADY